MPTLVQAALLGIVQGLTEFLPVSSTAHLLIGERLLGYDDPGGVFTVMIQLGSILAVDVAVSREDPRGRRRAAVRARGAPLRADDRRGDRAGARRRRAALEVREDACSTTASRSIAVAFIVGGIVMLIVERFRPRADVLDVDGLPVGRALGDRRRARRWRSFPASRARARRSSAAMADAASIGRRPPSSPSSSRCRRWRRRSRTICSRCGTISASARGAGDRRRLRDGVPRVGCWSSSRS